MGATGKRPGGAAVRGGVHVAAGVDPPEQQLGDQVGHGVGLVPRRGRTRPSSYWTSCRSRRTMRLMGWA